MFLLVGFWLFFFGGRDFSLMIACCGKEVFFINISLALVPRRC